MHRREKSAIQSHRKEIVDDLFLEEDLLLKMTREKLFTPGMVDDIKSQRTMRDKCHRLLELLQKRGPDAFPKFCAILREDYAWLVEKLEQTYQEKLTAEESEMVDSARTPRQLQLSFPPTPRETVPKRFTPTVSRKSSRNNQDTRNSTTFFPDNFGETFDETDGQLADLTENSLRNISDNTENGHKADACVSPIQTMSPSKHFSHTACSPFPFLRNTTDETFEAFEDEVDEEDNDDILSETVILSETHSSMRDRGEADAQIIATEGQAITENDTDINETDEDKILEELFIKLYKINTENESETEHHPVPELVQVTLAMVHEEIDKLVKRVDNSEASLDMAYQALGNQDTKTPIYIHIQKMQEMNKDLAQKLDKEKREKDSMVNDMYIVSQEMKRIDNLKLKIAKFETENKELKQLLEQSKQTNSDKEETIKELQKRLGQMERAHRQPTYVSQSPYASQGPQASVLQQSPSTRRRALGTARRTQPTGLNRHSTFDLPVNSQRTKFSFRKK